VTLDPDDEPTEGAHTCRGVRSGGAGHGSVSAEVPFE
jgi:hypothetical protein